MAVIKHIKEALSSVIVLPVAEGVGACVGVEKKLDPYEGFYITGYEVASRANVYARQMQILAKDGFFKNKKAYIVTAAKIDDGKLKNRKFLLTEAQAQRIGLLDAQNTEPSEKRRVILEKQITLDAVGQFLEPLAKIYPRARSLEVAKAHKDDIERINEMLGTRKGSWLLKLNWSARGDAWKHFRSNRGKGPTP